MFVMETVSSGYPITDEPISAEAEIPQSPAKASSLSAAEEVSLLEGAVSAIADVDEGASLSSEPNIPTIAGITMNTIKSQNHILL